MNGQVFAQAAVQNKQITAGEVVARIQKKVAEEGVTWDTSVRTFGTMKIGTVDTIKAGGPDTVVNGIATSFMSTLDVLQRAAASGKNFILTHEPTFWNHLDVTEDLQDDPIYRHKMDFIRRNNMVIWRFHDHQHRLKPDPIFVGFDRKLGWTRYKSSAGMFSPYEIPETTLKEVARYCQEKLESDSIRFIGDPDMKVKKVGMAGRDIASNMRVFPDVDAAMIPETREWDCIEYARDMVEAGIQKGLILLSHEACEEWGMEDCAIWLRGFIPEVPVDWISSRDPFWTPALDNQL